MEGFLANLKVRYAVLFLYGSKRVEYIVLKTLCILLFTIPFFACEIFTFIVGLVLLIPSFIPIICIPARLITYILEYITSWVYMLVMLADIIYDSENMKIAEVYNNKLNQY